MSLSNFLRAVVLAAYAAAAFVPAAGLAQPGRRAGERAARGAEETIDNPYGLGGAVGAGRLRRQGHADHPGDHVAWAAGTSSSPSCTSSRKLMRERRAAARRRSGSAGTRAARARTRCKEGSAFRFIAEQGLEADEHHEGTLIEHDRPATPGSRWRSSARSTNVAEPPAGRPGVPRHRRLDRAVRRPVRHGLGHLPRADRDRHRRPGVDRQGGRPGGRGADHDGHRPGGRGAGGARLQLAGPPQQGGDGARARASAPTCTAC